MTAKNLIVDPDSTKIYFSYGGTIYAIDADGSSISVMNVDDPTLNGVDLVREVIFFRFAGKENGVQSFYIGSKTSSNTLAMHSGALYKVKLA